MTHKCNYAFADGEIKISPSLSHLTLLSRCSSTGSVMLGSWDGVNLTVDQTQGSVITEPELRYLLERENERERLTDLSTNQALYLSTRHSSRQDWMPKLWQAASTYLDRYLKQYGETPRLIDEIASELWAEDHLEMDKARLLAEEVVGQLKYRLNDHNEFNGIGYDDNPLPVQMDTHGTGLLDNYPRNNWRNSAELDPEQSAFLDEPYKELYPPIWKGLKMRSDSKKMLEAYLVTELEKAGYSQIDKWLVFTCFGSGASYNWNEIGDLDIHIWVDADSFNQVHPDLNVTSDDLLVAMRRLIIPINSPELYKLDIESPMTVQYYPLAGKGTKDECLATRPYACYAMDTDEWYEKPYPLTPQHFADGFLLVEPKAKIIAEQAISLLGALDMDTADALYWGALYEKYDNEKYGEREEMARTFAEEDLVAVKALHLELFRERQKAYSPDGEGIGDERDLINKLMEVWGLAGRLKDEARTPLPWTVAEIVAPKTSTQGFNCPNCGSASTRETGMPNDRGGHYHLCYDCNEYFDPDEPDKYDAPGDLTIPEEWKLTWKQAMAEQSGDPELDRLISEFKTGTWKNLYGDQDQIEALKNPATALYQCNQLSNQFTKFLRDNGVKSMAHEANVKKWYDDAPEDGFPVHAVTVVEMPSGVYSVDWTASQYGYRDDFPMVQKMNNNYWMRQWSSVWKQAATGPDHDGVMVSVYCPHSIGRKLLIEGGEELDQLHITLAYFVDKAADRDDWEGAAQITAGWAKRTGPLKGRFGGYGIFFNEDGPVLWAAPDIKGLAKLRQELVDELDQAGFEVAKNHDFQPHCTLSYNWTEDIPQMKEPVHVMFPDLSITIGGDRENFPFDSDSDTIGDDDETPHDTQVPGSGEEARKSASYPQGQVVTAQADYYWPSPQEAMDLSYYAVDNHQGFRAPGLIDAAIGAARNQQVYGGVEDPYTLAAHLMNNIQRQQALVEGNKRTGLLLGLHFLEENGYETGNLPQEALADWILALAEKRATPEQMGQFLAQYSQAKMAATNPVDYQYVPLTDYELSLFEPLPRKERMKWFHHADNLNARGIKEGGKGKVSGRELYALAQRFENKCGYCDKDLHWGANESDHHSGTFDHNKPLDLGGENTAANLIPVCYPCNNAMEQWDVRDYGQPPGAVETSPLIDQPETHNEAWTQLPEHK